MTTVSEALERAAHRGTPVDPVALFERARLDAGAPASLAADVPDRPRRTGRLVPAIAAVLVLVVVAGVVAWRHDDDPSRVVTRPPVTTMPIRSIDGRMIPRTSASGTTVVLPITLPDGRHYQLRYPSDVDIASLGLRMVAQVDSPVTAQGGNGPMGCCNREFTLSYATVADLYPAAAPIATYPGADGSSVLLFHASQRRSTPSPYPTGDYLVFQFGPWVAEVWDSVPGSYAVVTPLDEAQRATWASQLRAEVDPDGFLVLRPQAPLQLADPKLVQVLFGDPNTIAGTPSISLWQFACGQSGSDTDVRRSFGTTHVESGVAWCDPVTGFHVSAAGSTAFTAAIGTGLVLRDG